jgi:hypothetical protein
MWVRSHVGIPGNEKADTTAYEATSFIPFHHIIPFHHKDQYTNLVRNFQNYASQNNGRMANILVKPTLQQSEKCKIVLKN